MHRPVLVTAVLPLTVGEVKLSLRVDGSDLDDEIKSQIEAAVAHYQGWTGILGISLAEQNWQQDFDRFDRSMCLPVGPVVSVTSVTWRNAAGQVATVAPASYALRADAGGQSTIRFDATYVFPTGLHESGAVSVLYKAGWPMVGDISTLPADLKTAIKLRVQTMIDEAAMINSQHLERIENALIGKYRRMMI